MSKQAKRDRQRLNREARREYELTLARRRKTFKTLRTFAFIAIPVVALIVVTNLSGGGDTKSVSTTPGCRTVKQAPKAKDITFANPEIAISAAKTYTALVDTSCGSFTITLNSKEAPKNVNSFVFLSKKGFFDGLTFHRISKDFVIQGGDPKGDGSGGPGYTLPDEPPTAGYQKGSVAMANAGAGTGGSQFFVALSDAGAKNLGGPPYKYSILGQVTDGFETVTRIGKLAKPGTETPKQIVLIDKVTITEAPATP